MTDQDWQQRFHHSFLQELRGEGHSAKQIANWMWRPFGAADVKVLGEGRDLDYDAISLTEEAAEQALADASEPAQTVDKNFYADQNIVLVLVPGFTHETLKNLSWHEQMERKNSPHDIRMLKPGVDGGATEEDELANGGGLKVVYAQYPRSNGASEDIIEPLFKLLHDSASVRRWVVDEGRKLVFVGYSYGSPLSLEMLAALNTGQWQDDFVLANTAGFLGLCGDIGGAYLADDIISENPEFVSLAKLIGFFERHPKMRRGLLGKLAGINTDQLFADLPRGAASLGHAKRQAHIAEYAGNLPAHVKYFTISAVMPPADYKRYFWQFNLDDWSMFKQGEITQKLTVYNDGQVALPDNLMPDCPQVPDANKIHLGAVRTHHWGVSYKTFNMGNNKFPRPAFYRALMRTITEALAEAG